MIDVKIETTQDVNVIHVIGEVDATNALIVQQNVMPLSEPGCKLIMDLSRVAYMSSAGLRMLLSLYRQTSSKQGNIILVGLSDDLKDTMSMTGFLGYFTVADSVEQGISSLG